MEGLTSSQVEQGFWATVEVCRAGELPVQFHEMQLYRLFFMSGVAFGAKSPEAMRWQEETLELAAKERKKP